MADSVSQRGARGAVVTLAGQAAKVATQLVSLVVLGRILSPTDFGLVAMVTVFAAFGGQIRDLGIPTAALQARTLSRQQASNLFWINSGIGALVAASLWAATPLIIELYGEPRLANILPYSALAILFNGLQAQQQIQMVRDMRFRAVAATEIASQMAALLIAIAGALAGLGYLALAWQTLAAPTALLLLRFFVARFVPSYPRRDGATLPLLRSGLYIGGAQLLTLLSKSVDTLVVGSRWGATVTGHYDRAFTLATQIPSNFITPLMNVVIPTVNRLRSEGRDVNLVLLKVQQPIAAIGVWVMLLAATTAPWLIPLLLGAQWEPTIILFRWFTLGGAVIFCSASCYWAFLLHDRAPLLFWNDMVAKSVFVILILLGGLISIDAVAIAYSTSVLVGWFVNLLFLRHYTDFPAGTFLSAGARFLWAGAVGFAAVWPLGGVLNDLGGIGAITISATASSAFYLLAIIAAPGGSRTLRDIQEGIRQMRSSSST